MSYDFKPCWVCGKQPLVINTEYGLYNVQCSDITCIAADSWVTERYWNTRKHERQEAEQGEVDAKIDLAYVDGMREGWNLAHANTDESYAKFKRIIHSRTKAAKDVLRKQPQPRSEQPTTIDDLLRDMRCEVEYTHVATMPIPLYERMKAVIKGKPPAKYSIEEGDCGRNGA